MKFRQCYCNNIYRYQLPIVNQVLERFCRMLSNFSPLVSFLALVRKVTSKYYFIPPSICLTVSFSLITFKHLCKFSFYSQAEVLAKMGTFEESNRIINDIKGFNSNAECLYVKALCLYSKVGKELLVFNIHGVISTKWVWWYLCVCVCVRGCMYTWVFCDCYVLSHVEIWFKSGDSKLVNAEE